MGEITWTNITVKLSELEPWGRNPRQIKRAQGDRLVQSYAEFGDAEPILVAPMVNGKYPLLNGHQRAHVLASKHGMSFEIAARLASRPLTEPEREKLTILLHAGAVGSWDWESIANSWDVPLLQEWGFDRDTLRDWGQNFSALNIMLETKIDPKAEWEGMPEFEQEDLGAVKSITVHFATMEDVQNFSDFIGQTLTAKTKYIWYPKKEREDLLSIRCQDES